MADSSKLESVFNAASLKRNHSLYKLSRTLHDHLSFMQSKIRKQLKSFTLLSICGGERSKFSIDAYFEAAYTAFTLQEKVFYYQKTVNLIMKAQSEKQSGKITSQVNQLKVIQNIFGSNIRIIIEINTGFRSWEEETIIVSGFKINSQKKINLDLRNYLIRKSKKKDVDCHVLEAVRLSKPQTIRFTFKRKQQEDKYLGMIKNLIDIAYFSYLSAQAFSATQTGMKKNKNGSTFRIAMEQPPGITLKKVNSPIQIPNQVAQIPMKRTHSISVSYELMKSKDEQQIYEDLKDLIDQQNQKNCQQSSIISETQKKPSKIKKNYKNIFGTMMNNSILDQLESLQNYQPVFTDAKKRIFIFKNSRDSQKFKVQFSCDLDPKTTIMALYNVELYKIWHPAVCQSHQKIRISSQNCSIFYQKHQAYSQWYRQRDYLYLKHVFQLKNSYYIADKSFENTNFIPFNSIQRGKINYSLAKISQAQSGSKITMQISIEHGGVLKQSHCDQLTVNYLKGFSQMQTYFVQQQFRSKLLHLFSHSWNIEQTLINSENYNEPSQTHLNTYDFQAGSQISKDMDQSDVFYSVVDSEDEKDINIQTKKILEEKQIEDREINEQQIVNNQKKKHQRQQKAKIQLDGQGRIVKPNDYLKKHHITEPIETNKVRIQRQFDDFLLKDNWSYIPTGGMEIINQKKIQAQNSVFAFLIKKIKQNIFSGKGLTNISLPVQVFNCDSNLSRMCYGFSLAPQFLQKAAKQKNPIERLKWSMIFGLASSIFFLDAEKPFNPILGQTYQGFIDGCPVYAQQISHHPPITAFYMIGRGYKIRGSIQAKVNLHINSADGLNQGFTSIQFDDGQIIQYDSPAGQVNNTTMGGNRQFNFLGKGFYYDRKNLLYAELKFQEESGYFSKSSWKYRDQVESQIFKIKDSYMDKIDAKVKDKKSPAQKDIVQKYNKLSGRWPFDICWDQKVVFNQNKDLPFKLQNYEYPLHSDVFYREDIHYRILEDLARSQIQKERLQVLQRGDRKFREKYGPKQKH